MKHIWIWDKNLKEIQFVPLFKVSIGISASVSGEELVTSGNVKRSTVGNTCIRIKVSLLWLTLFLRKQRRHPLPTTTPAPFTPSS